MKGFGGKKGEKDMFAAAGLSRKGAKLLGKMGAEGLEQQKG